MTHYIDQLLRYATYINTKRSSICCPKRMQQVAETMSGVRCAHIVRDECSICMHMSPGDMFKYCMQGDWTGLQEGSPVEQTA